MLEHIIIFVADVIKYSVIAFFCIMFAYIIFGTDNDDGYWYEE